MAAHSDCSPVEAWDDAFIDLTDFCTAEGFDHYVEFIRLAKEIVPELHGRVIDAIASAFAEMPPEKLRELSDRLGQKHGANRELLDRLRQAHGADAI